MLLFCSIYLCLFGSFSFGLIRDFNCLCDGLITIVFIPLSVCVCVALHCFMFNCCLSVCCVTDSRPWIFIFNPYNHRLTGRLDIVCACHFLLRQRTARKRGRENCTHNIVTVNICFLIRCVCFFSSFPL